MPPTGVGVRDRFLEEELPCCGFFRSTEGARVFRRLCFGCFDPKAVFLRRCAVGDAGVLRRLICMSSVTADVARRDGDSLDVPVQRADSVPLPSTMSRIEDFWRARLAGGFVCEVTERSWAKIKPALSNF